jgi:hypothetical protein
MKPVHQSIAARVLTQSVYVIARLVWLLFSAIGIIGLSSVLGGIVKDAIYNPSLAPVLRVVFVIVSCSIVYVIYKLMRFMMHLITGR